MFKSKIFTTWYFSALVTWGVLFATFNSIQFLIENWYYPAIMFAGAFVAGFTPEGGGAVAFPILSVFLHVDRVLARDFSMMIQSVGMTSASIWILTNKETDRKDYRPCWVFVPVCYAGMVLGFQFFQQIPVYIIQALFVSLSATFVTAYYFSDHRGTETRLRIKSNWDTFYLGVLLIAGGIVSSLFGTGGDILLYMFLITRFNMTAKIAVRISIVLQASLSILGYAYRAIVDHGPHGLTNYQIRTWLCAFPVALFMAPFGAYILARLHVNWMLRGIILLNLFQLVWFNAKDFKIEKLEASGIFTVLLSATFYFALKHVSKLHREQAARDAESSPPIDQPV
jgi:uncharacterized membrane protein YfcA